MAEANFSIINYQLSIIFIKKSREIRVIRAKIIIFAA